MYVIVKINHFEKILKILNSVLSKWLRSVKNISRRNDIIYKTWQLLNNFSRNGLNMDLNEPLKKYNNYFAPITFVFKTLILFIAFLFIIICHFEKWFKYWHIFIRSNNVLRNILPVETILFIKLQNFLR